MANSSSALRLEKTSGASRRASAGQPIAWPDVVRAVSGVETRSYVVQRLRDRGFSVDDFTHARFARETVADALNRSEDRLELKGPKAQAERAAVRNVRRRLEWELWP